MTQTSEQNERTIERTHAVLSAIIEHAEEWGDCSPEILTQLKQIHAELRMSVITILGERSSRRNDYAMRRLAEVGEAEREKRQAEAEAFLTELDRVNENIKRGGR